MSRLPTPGGDDNTWGNVLNEYLQISHNSDGTLQTGALRQAGGVTSVNGQAPAGGSVTLTPSTIGAAAGLVATAVKTADYTAAVSDFVPVDASAASVTVTLPTTPADQSRVAVKAVKATSPNVVTVNAGGSASFNDDGATSLSLKLPNQVVVLQYASAADIWYVQSEGLPLVQADARYLQFDGSMGDGAQRIGIPLYVYPTWFSPTGAWQTAQAAAPYVSFVIADPASGPGASLNTDYVTQIKRAQASGAKVLGYVTSNYTAVTQASVKAQIDSWYSWYNVDGIFIDQVASAAGSQPYYVPLYNYIKAKSGVSMVVINPGTPPDESYMQVCDVCCDFEGDYSTYSSFVPPTWRLNYPTSHFMELVYNANTVTKLDQALVLSRKYRAGYIYVTDDNGWTSLAGTNSGGLYWQRELSWIASSGLAVPTPGASAAVTVNTTASIASLASLTVPSQLNIPDGGTPAAGARYAIRAYGTLGTDVSPPTYTLDLRWGGTTGTLIASLQSAAVANAPSLTGSLSAVPVLIEGEVTFLSATTCIGWLRMTWQNSGTATTAPVVALATVTSPVTVTTSSSQDLSLDWTWGTSSASNTITIASSTIERVA